MSRDAGGGGVDSGAPADGGGTAIDGGGAADGGGPAVLCAFVDDLERGCGADENCVVGVHQSDCCGNTVAIGMNHAERDRFDAAEAPCRASYPGCGCPSGPTTTDSGETTLDPSAIQVACVPDGASMTCMTYVTERPTGG